VERFGLAEVAGTGRIDDCRRRLILLGGAPRAPASQAGRHSQLNALAASRRKPVRRAGGAGSRHLPRSAAERRQMRGVARGVTTTTSRTIHAIATTLDDCAASEGGADRGPRAAHRR
jgi:hypothetical protein